MPRSCISCFLFTLTTALITNWTSKSGISAYVLSSYEEDAISVFRDLVQDLATKDFMKADGYLLRWLRYTNFDLEKAHSAFAASTKWRKENNIDSILEEGFSSYEESYKYSINGLDKEGRPVVFIPVGSYDVRKVTISGEQFKYQRCFIRAFELTETYLQEIRDRTGFDNITQVVIVDDLAGFNLKQTACLACLKILPDFIAHYEPNYPLIFHKIFVINAPVISYSAVQAAKHFMSQATKESLQVFDYDKDKWSKALLEQISPENLPMKYGGIKPDFDKASFATRNAALMHLLGNGEHGSEVKATTVPSSSHPNYDHNHKKIEKDIDVTPNIVSPIVLESKPISWFDSAAAEFDLIAPENKLKESNSKVLNLTKPAEINKDQERDPINQQHKQRHHHHYEKVNRCNKSERFANSAKISSTVAEHVSSAAINNTGNYVWFMSMIFVNFIIFGY